jgi:hypothetical protein
MDRSCGLKLSLLVALGLLPLGCASTKLSGGELGGGAGGDGAVGGHSASGGVPARVPSTIGMQS